MYVALMLKLAPTNTSECLKILVSSPICVEWMDAKKDEEKFKELA